MSKSGKILLEENGVLTQEALLAYVEGRLPEGDMAQFEKLLRDDPFAQDAVEGLKNSKDKTQIRSSVSNINERLRTRTNFKTRTQKTFQIHWANYAYAAAVFGVLIGLGVVLINFLNTRDSKSDQVAMNAEEQQPLAAPDSQVAKPADTSQLTMLPDTSTLHQSEIKVADSASLKLTAAPDQPKNTPVPPIKPDANKDEKPLQPIAQRMSETKTKSTADMRTNTAAPAVQAGAGLASEADAEKEVAAERKKQSADKSAQPVAPATKSELQQAKDLFDNGDFTEAEKKYNKILDADPANNDALFFGGICNYIKGENKKAEKAFDKLIDRNMYTDGAKWYKANLLIRKGKNEPAKDILRQLSGTNNGYKDRAVKKYEEISKYAKTVQSACFLLPYSYSSKS